MAHRFVSSVVLIALVVVFWGSVGGFAAGREDAGEPCLGCADCDSGPCDADGVNPLTSHHHCCTTCCVSHAPLALVVPRSAQSPVTPTTMVTPKVAPTADRSPETPHLPPRV
ncbi:MAG TPA: hypothetical protein VD788_03800 [Candidatus Polarisedimenticolaceae bacterium]|nr:hypothetical protein [Candidatus Polarisedimenticolaceae bacterium]